MRNYKSSLPGLTISSSNVYCQCTNQLQWPSFPMVGCTSTNVFLLLSLATNSCLVNVLAMHLEAPQHCSSVAYRSKYTNCSPSTLLFIYSSIIFVYYLLKGGMFHQPAVLTDSTISNNYIYRGVLILLGANKYSSGVRCVRTNHLQRFCFCYFLFHVCSFSTASTDLAGDRCQPPHTNI